MHLVNDVVATTQKVGNAAWVLAGKCKRVLLPQRDYVTYRGSRLPPRGLRFNGPDHADEAFLLASANVEAQRVTERLGYEPSQLLVDIGCGQGRLAIGLARRFDTARYLGLDVSARSIEWCSKHITGLHPSYRFEHLDLVNARYNPDGRTLSSGFRLPVDDGAAGIVYVWGVVTNMEPSHLAVYAREMNRMLRSGGRAFLTANVEDDVAPVSINPPNYVSFEYNGPLHIVRYERRYLLETFEQAGFALEAFDYHATSNCQSDLYFVKK